MAFFAMPHRAASPAMSENELDITNSLFQADADEDDFAQPTSKVAGILDAGGILDLGLESDGDGDDAFIAAQQAASNRKASNVKGKSVKKGGGFQAMGTKLSRFKNSENSANLRRAERKSTQGYQQKRLLCSDTNSAKDDPSCSRQSGCCGYG